MRYLYKYRLAQAVLAEHAALDAWARAPFDLDLGPAMVHSWACADVDRESARRAAQGIPEVRS